MSESPVPAGYRIGDIEVDVLNRRVRRNNEHLSLGKLTWRLLLALAEAAPGMLTRKQLVDKVWEGRFASPATVKQRVILLRDALSDDAGNPQYLRVIRGEGYALIPPVVPLYRNPHPSPVLRRPGFAWGASALLGIACLLLLIFALFDFQGIQLIDQPEAFEDTASITPDPDPARSETRSGFHMAVRPVAAGIE